MTRLRDGLRAYALLLRWNAAASKELLPLTVVVSIMMSAGIVIGFGYLAPVEIPEVALRLATGAPTILLLTTGMVIVPQVVGTMKSEGSYDWFRSLPAPRAAFLFADLTVWILVSLPGIAIAVGIGWLRYDLDLAPTIGLVPVALAVTGTAAMVGYAMATALPPRIAQLLTQVIIFFILLFSPITFPMSQLPGWLATVHEVLPIAAMADLLRANLAPAAYTATAGQALLVTAWGIAACAITLRLMTRRV